MTEQEDAREEPLVFVARAVKTRGLKGEIVADLLTDFPDRFDEVSELIGVGPRQKRIVVDLEGHWFQKDRVILKFRGYDNIEAAADLVGYSFGVPEEDRVKLNEGSYYNWELEGCEVATISGAAVGKVKSVVPTGGVALLNVCDSSGHEVLVPMAEAIVVHIDIEKKTILIDPPEGLLEL